MPWFNVFPSFLEKRHDAKSLPIMLFSIYLKQKTAFASGWEWPWLYFLGGKNCLCKKGEVHFFTEMWSRKVHVSSYSGSLLSWFPLQEDTIIKTSENVPSENAQFINEHNGFWVWIYFLREQETTLFNKMLIQILKNGLILAYCSNLCWAELSQTPVLSDMISSNLYTIL